MQVGAVHREHTGIVISGDDLHRGLNVGSSHAQLHPRLFEVAHEYEFADFQKAIQHVSCPGKSGIVLLKSPL